MRSLYRWRPNLFAQFLIGVAILLVPLAMVVLVFLQALDKHMGHTQQMVLSSYQKNEEFNEFKQLFQSLERATLQNWVLQSEPLSELVTQQWAKAEDILQTQVAQSSWYNEQSRWQELKATLTATKEALQNTEQHNAQLFSPLRQQINAHSQWLHEHTKEQVTQAQQDLGDLQQSFIHWLMALVPIALLVGGGYLWRISHRLGYLSRVISRLGKGDWDVPITLTGAQELHELGEKLQWMQQQLQALEQQKDTFLRHVTHELKTPLASMVEGCDLLSEELVGPINEQQRDVLGLISQSTERLHTMIQNLLNYNAISAREKNDKHCDVSALKQQVNEHFHERLKAKKQRLHWHYDATDSAIKIDGELLQMILTQLISNAIKFTPEMGQIEVTIAHTNTHINIDVCDQGPGIDEQEKTRLFDAFYQGSAGKNNDLQGSGLGLSIVKECVQQLGGQVSIHSASPHGSCFKLAFNR